MKDGDLKKYVDYDPVTGIFTCKLTGRVLGLGKDRYSKVRFCGLSFLAQRLAWFFVTGAWPKDQIDHIDGNPWNNSFINLREATHSQNRANAPAFKNSKSKVRGVHLHKCGRYRVQFQKHGKSYHGGYFSTLIEAEEAAKVLAIKVHGEFACPTATRLTTRERLALM